MSDNTTDETAALKYAENEGFEWIRKHIKDHGYQVYVLDCDPREPMRVGFLAGRKSATPDVEELHAAISAVLFNVSNYPEAVQARMLGQDTSPLTEKIRDAVLAYLQAPKRGRRCEFRVDVMARNGRGWKRIRDVQCFREAGHEDGYGDVAHEFLIDEAHTFDATFEKGRWVSR